MTPRFRMAHHQTPARLGRRGGYSFRPMSYRLTLGGTTHVFRDLKDLLARATPLRSGDQLALVPLRMLRRIFAVERLSTLLGETPEERLRRRQEYSAPVIAELRACLDDNRAVIPPKTPLGKAIGYLQRQWARLVLFLTDGRLELTNNRLERELRALVLGRNYAQFPLMRSAQPRRHRRRDFARVGVRIITARPGRRADRPSARSGLDRGWARRACREPRIPACGCSCLP